MLTAEYPEGIGCNDIARTCGVSIRTAQRWQTRGRMPRVYALGYALLRDGDLGTVSRAWRGWRLLQDEIISPEGWHYRPGELAAGPIQAQLIAELRRQLRQPAQFDLLAAAAR